MTTRIRYREVHPNVLVTRNPLLAVEKTVNVTLHLNDMEFTVVDTSSNDVLASGKAKTSLALKKAAKAALKALGVNFSDETRQGKVDPSLKVS